MSDEAPTATAATAEQTPEADPKPTETVEFWRTKAREQEKRAKANADAAQRLAAMEEAQKTAEQRLADQLTAAQREADTAKAEALRYRIATRYGISDDDADLYLTATDEDMLERQAKGLAERAAAPGVTPGPRPDLSQGKTSDVALNSDALLDTVKSKLGIT